MLLKILLIDCVRMTCCAYAFMLNEERSIHCYETRKKFSIVLWKQSTLFRLKLD